jgi:hypothetical protein
MPRPRVFFLGAVPEYPSFAAADAMVFWAGAFARIRKR